MTGVCSKQACAALLTAAAMLRPIAGHAQEPVIVLPPIQVEGEAPRDSTRDKYLKEVSPSATKTDTPIIETPQSITTITREQLDDQNPQSVKDALNYTAGVLSSPDTTSRYDSVFLRGFGGFGTSTQIVDFLDGLRLPRGQGFALPSIDPFLLDRIDVLKGPSAVLYGNTSPGGLVNQFSRSPSAASYTEGRIEGGSYVRAQAGVTGQGAIDDAGHWQYSLSSIGRRSGTRYDNVEEERLAVGPAIRWQPDPDTQLTLQGFYQYDPEGGYLNSILPRSLAPAAFKSDLDPDLNVGDPDFESFDREQYAVGYGFAHRFNDVVSVSSRTRFSTVDLDFRGIQMTGFPEPISATGEIPRQAVRSIEDVGGLATDNRAQVNFQTGVVEHTALAGVDFQHSVSDWEYQFIPIDALDVTNPEYGVSIPPLVTAIDNQQTLQQTGVYVQEQLSLGGLHLVLGARYDWAEQENDNRPALLTPNGRKNSLSRSSPSYRAGLLYKFDIGLAPYVSYSTSFQPNVGFDFDDDGNFFEPTEAEQFEVGLKYQPTFMNAHFTASAFEIRQENVVTPGPTPGLNVQQGEIRSRGIELEVRGNATQNLEIIGALTLIDTEVTEAALEENEGNRPQATPEYFGSAWANYSFDSGPLDGFSLGGGVRFVGSSFADDANTVKADGFVLVDAAVRYDLEKLSPLLSGTEITVNATNLLDEEYYSSCSSGFFCQYGNGLQVLLGLRYRL